MNISSEDVRRYWNQNAETWTDHVRRGWDTYREVYNNPAFLAFLGDVRGLRVLDAGCGEGTNTRILAEAGASTTGVDIADNMIRAAREREEREPLGSRFEAGSFCDLGQFGTCSFDLAVSFMAIMDGPDFPAAVRELYRVLKPGGDLVFSILHPCFNTKGLSWLRDEDGTCTGSIQSDYYDTTPRVEQWRFTKGGAPKDAPMFAVPRFPLTLSDYVTGLIQAGFRLMAIEEPRPSEALCGEHPWLWRFRNHAAPFLYVRARKDLQA
ncbi:MAG: methyltransferase domain-containing protein [bacterium]|nr:methyltransferase domain-containing protein [bacterium]